MEFRWSVLTYPFSQIDLFPAIYKYSIAYHFDTIPSATPKNKSTMPIMPITEDYIFSPDKEIRHLPMDVYATDGNVMIYVDFAEMNKPIVDNVLKQKLEEIESDLKDSSVDDEKGSSVDDDLGF